jgi:hypothetical protein
MVMKSNLQPMLLQVNSCEPILRDYDNDKQKVMHTSGTTVSTRRSLSGVNCVDS